MTDAVIEKTSEVQAADAETIESYAKLCDQRAGIYALLGRLYKKEVDQECLDMLCGMRFPVASGNEDMDEGYYRLATYLNRSKDDMLLDLARDYVHCFIGMGNSGYCAAYPYESVYTNEKRLIMQEACDEVRVIYRSAGLEKSKEWREGEDHVAIELEYMQVLSTRAAEELRAGNVDGALAHMLNQYNFLEDHLLAWVPAFLIDLMKFAKSDFYQGVAYLTKGFLKVEEDFLYDLLEEDELN